MASDHCVYIVLLRDAGSQITRPGDCRDRIVAGQRLLPGSTASGV